MILEMKYVVENFRKKKERGFITGLPIYESVLDPYLYHAAET